MVLNMEKKILKCKLVFEWKEPDVEDLKEVEEINNIQKRILENFKI